MEATRPSGEDAPRPACGHRWSLPARVSTHTIPYFAPPPQTLVWHSAIPVILVVHQRGLTPCWSLPRVSMGCCARLHASRWGTLWWRVAPPSVYLLAVLTPVLWRVGHASAPPQPHPPAGTADAVAPAQSTRFFTGCPRWHRRPRSRGSPAPPGIAVRSGPRPGARATRYMPRRRRSDHPWRGPSRSGGAVTTPDGSPSNNCPTPPQRPWPCRSSHPEG